MNVERMNDVEIRIMCLLNYGYRRSVFVWWYSSLGQRVLKVWNKELVQKLFFWQFVMFSSLTLTHFSIS
jgi:hypothetical protein